MKIWLYLILFVIFGIIFLIGFIFLVFLMCDFILTINSAWLDFIKNLPEVVGIEI